MAQRNEKVFDRIRQELGKNPNLGSKELYEVAQGVDKEIGQDSLQQFHARYVLPVKRERGGAPKSAEGGRKPRASRKSSGQGSSSRGRAGTRRGKAATAPAAAASEAAQPAGAQRTRAPRQQRSQSSQGGTSRDQVRALLLQFAQELTDAESRSSLVKVLGKVDSYVDRIAPAQA